MSNQKKLYILFAICLLVITGFWFYSLKLNLQNIKNSKTKSGLSFAELKQEINNIINKSPLNKKEDQLENDELKELTQKLAEELKNTETLKHLNNETQEGETDTSNWQTYTNEKYGFEVKYPFGWNLHQGTEPYLVGFIPPNKKEEGEYYGDITLEVYPNPTRLDLKTLYPSYFTGPTSAKEISTIKIGDVTATKFEGVSGMLAYTIVAIPYKQLVVKIIDNNELHQEDGVFDQIVASFKFIK